MDGTLTLIAFIGAAIAAGISVMIIIHQRASADKKSAESLLFPAGGIVTTCFCIERNQDTFSKTYAGSSKGIVDVVIGPHTLIYFSHYTLFGRKFYLPGVQLTRLGRGITPMFGVNKVMTVTDIEEKDDTLIMRAGPLTNAYTTSDLTFIFADLQMLPKAVALLMIEA